MSHFPNLRHYQEQRQHCRSEANEVNDTEAMHWQTLQLTETVLGKDHPLTLGSMTNFALALEKQGKYAEAEAMYQRDEIC